VLIVYSVSFSDPAGYFLATRVQMHNKDVIFAANAQSVEITKFTTFINALFSVPLNVTDLGINVETWPSTVVSTPAVVPPSPATP
jgi:polysaccharide biosynthesis/export protein